MKILARGALCLTLVCVSCSGAKPVPQQKLNRFGRPYKEGIVVPAWVDHPPENARGKLLAVGFSLPTYWPQDALNNAAEDARGKLALALGSHVEVLGMDTASGARTGGATIDKEATDLVLQNSRIEATWVDENGDRSEPASVWALASIELDSVKGSLHGAAPAVATMGAPGSVKTPAWPAWLDRLPGSSGKLFATGYSGPTFEPARAVGYAGDNAMDNLAASLRAHVQAYTLLVENGFGLSVDAFAKTDDPDAAFLELVKKGAKLEATWVDQDGLRPGDPPGAVWALVSIDVRSTRGSAQAVENQDLGPALDDKGNAPADAPAPAPVQPAPAAATKGQ